MRTTSTRRDVEPTYGTRRRPERPTLGPACAAMANLLGIELLPWQRRFVDVFGELVLDAESDLWIPAYSDGSLSVGRRAGKSLLLLVYALRAMFAQPRAACRFTAQDRTSAVLQLREAWIPLLSTVELGEHVAQRLTNGSEALTVPHNGSFLRLFAPTPTSLHGLESSLVLIDEGFAFSAERGADISLAVKPTTYTVPGAQVLWSSAAGDLDSTWWAETLEHGRAAVIEDRGRGLCHMEWTVDGTELDPDDEETWRLVHPGNIPLDVLRTAHDRNRTEFYRTILNMTDRVGSSGSPIDVAQWGRLRAQSPGSRRSTMTLGVDCGPDQSTGAIVAATDAGRCVEVIDHRPGTDWIPSRVVELVDRYPVEVVGFEPGGPAGALVAPLEALGIPLRLLNLREVAGAAAAFGSLVSTSRVRHVPDASLDAAVEGARRRLVGDGSWTISRRNSTADVAPLLAAIFAVAVHPETYDSQGPTIV